MYVQELSCCWDGRVTLNESNFCFLPGVPLFTVNALFLSNLYTNTTINHILPKTRFCELHYCCGQCDVIGIKTTELREIMQNNVYYDIHGYHFPYKSKARTLLSMSEWICLIIIYILSLTVFKLLQIIGHFLLSTGVPLFNVLLHGETHDCQI